MKLTTINLITEAILEETPGSKKTKEERANEAVIILKTALICEKSGIALAMDYYFGGHGQNEFEEFRTFMVGPEEEQKKVRYKSLATCLSEQIPEIGLTIDGYLMISKDGGKTYDTVFDSVKDADVAQCAKGLFNEEKYE